MARGALDQLTEAQRECLRLVVAHHSSKEIAEIVGVSPSAVDKRLERAVQLLGVSSRFAAARLLAASEGGPAYEQTTSEPSDLPPATTLAELTVASRGGSFAGCWASSLQSGTVGKRGTGSPRRKGWA